MTAPARLTIPEAKAIWRWRFFKADEPGVACRCCQTLVVVPGFWDALDELRRRIGRPLVVNSGYRCPDHNAQVSNSGRTGPHTTGRAVDLRCHGTLYYDLIAMAPSLGFTGLGSDQRLSIPHTRRFIHLDDLPATAQMPRPWGWSYP